MRCVRDFRVELNAEKTVPSMAHGRVRARRGRGKRDKIVRQLIDLVAVAHPGRCLLGQAVEQVALIMKLQRDPAEIARRSTEVGRASGRERG